MRPTPVQAHHGKEKELHMLVVERIMHTLIIIIDMVVWLAGNQNQLKSYTLGMKLSIRPLITGQGLSRFLLLTVELATRWGHITPHKEVLNAII